MCVPSISQCLKRSLLLRCKVALDVARRFKGRSRPDPPCYPPPDCCPPGCVPPPPPGMFTGCCPDPCCPQPPPPCPGQDCAGRKTMCPPPCCYPGPIPPNPCCPRFYKTHSKRYRSLFFFILLPLIILQTLNALGSEPCHKGPCREYEYMRRRTKRFPWGDGNKTFFHNDHYNSLPEECEPPPLVCYPEPQPCD